MPDYRIVAQNRMLVLTQIVDTEQEKRTADRGNDKKPAIVEDSTAERCSRGHPGAEKHRIALVGNESL